MCFLVSLFAACNSADNDNEKKFNQVAYYKDDAKMRVFVYITQETNLEVLKNHAKEQMHTDGSTTAVFYYNELVVSTQNATMARNFHDALGYACTKSCIAGYWKYANGGETFNENPCEDE